MHEIQQIALVDTLLTTSLLDREDIVEAQITSKAIEVDGSHLFLSPLFLIELLLYSCDSMFHLLQPLLYVH
jgi:hypothetical protein